MPGPERALLYLLAMETGLRWSELASLTRSSFDLDGDPPTVTVQAAYSKHRREDILPLRPTTAASIRRVFGEHAVELKTPLFPHMPKNRMGSKMIRVDLTAASERGKPMGKPAIPYVDPSGAVADFHALRHSFISALAQGGVHPKTAQDLARHSDINLTLSRYTHTLLEDRSDALGTLPDMSLKQPSRADLQATGTDGEKCLAPNLAPARTI
jgi:integrase